ncbi:MAG: HNH endonuclease [Gammaproteobacteria bacterium]|nr:HNH endonuclease [Gammaproteobacteria bacterium]
MSVKYSLEQLQFLKQGFKLKRVPELTAEFNEKFSMKKTETAIKNVLTKNGFKCGRKGGLPKGHSLLFTEDQVEFLKSNCVGVSKEKLTGLLNDEFDTSFTVHQIRTYSKNNKLISGLTGRFEKGHKTWNEGTIGLVKPNSGNFKKGSTPHNRKPLGHERICPVDGYILIKIAEHNPYKNEPTRYKAKHIVNWEKENGPVPDGMIVTFKDDNKLNCDPDNLELITRAENLYRNRHGYTKLPGELKPTMTLLAKIETKRFAFEKERKDHEQP